ncbi:hypothetical protein KAI04_01525 [Candidatus Pacearchaeota archaeon]|nr:hypothetical protein [Candidatus Pacearchaeota archaeon]
MYKKLSKKYKSIFWLINIFLLVLLIYSITLIPSANIYELIIAGLGWVYIFGTIIAWFNMMPDFFIMKKKLWIKTFSIIAIIGIVAAIILNIVFNVTRLSQAIPITIIPAVIVIAYFIIVLIRVSKNKIIL